MIVAPQLSAGQRESFLALLEVTEAMPDHWCLVGGQMVHLHCWERGYPANRPTDDADAALDVRGYPQVLRAFTQTLVDLGFSSAGESMDGHQHRWVRGDAQIDVLIATNLGEKATARRGVTGGTTLASNGVQQALDRAEKVAVSIDGTEGVIPRPDLRGALVGKAAAFTNPGDAYRARHLLDFAVLAALMQRGDDLGTGLSPHHRSYLTTMLHQLDVTTVDWRGIEGAVDGVARVRLAIGQ